MAFIDPDNKLELHANWLADELDRIGEGSDEDRLKAIIRTLRLFGQDIERETRDKARTIVQEAANAIHTMEVAPS